MEQIIACVFRFPKEVRHKQELPDIAVRIQRYFGIDVPHPAHVLRKTSNATVCRQRATTKTAARCEAVFLWQDACHVRHDATFPYVSSAEFHGAVDFCFAASYVRTPPCFCKMRKMSDTWSCPQSNGIFDFCICFVQIQYNIPYTLFHWWIVGHDAKKYQHKTCKCQSDKK